MSALAMSEAERRRVAVFGRVRDGQLTVAAAAAELGVSERQAWRLKRRYADGGDAGLVHGLRGRPSTRKAEASSRAAVVELCRAKYAGWGPTLASEYLAKGDGWEVSHDTLGRWLRAEGLLGRVGGGVASTAVAGRGGSGAGSWCRWTGAGTTGSGGVGRGAA